MSFRSIVRDVKDGIGSLSRRRFEAVLSGHSKDKSHRPAQESDDKGLVEQNSCWAALPVELLYDIIKRLEESESSWPARRSVVACASVCRAWRQICKEIVKAPEFSGRLTFPASLKQPGSRNDHIQCFIRRDELRSTYHLYLCLNAALFVDKGKFLLSARRIQRSTCREYIISMEADSIYKHSPNFMGKLRSNFIGDRFVIHDTQPPDSGVAPSAPRHFRRRFYCKKVSPKSSVGNYNIAEVRYEMSVHGAHSPRRMSCTMYSIPALSVDVAGGSQEDALQDPLEDSFRSMSFSNSSTDLSTDSSSSNISSHHSIRAGVAPGEERRNNKPLVLRSKNPRWHEQLQCWCLNFHGRVTVASVKNFQLIAASNQPATSGVPLTPVQSGSMDHHDKVLLQFGKVGKDIFTMDYRYPLSAFQAFAICLSSLDNKIGRE